MPSTEERLTLCEANDKNIFHQLDEIKDELKDQRNLVVAVEKIATETKQIAEKVDRIDKRTGDAADKLAARVSDLEAVPGRNYNRIKDITLTAIITGVLGTLIGAVLALILK